MPFLLNLHPMKSISGYILVLIFALVLNFDSLAQDRAVDDMDARLAEYEALCRECLALKARVASGERLSRDEAEGLLSSFVAVNRSLKDCEDAMTVVQRQRFVAIGRWFSTGEPPQMPDQAVLQMSVVPSVTLVGPPAEPLTWRPVQLCPKSRGQIYLLADLAMPQLSYGLMAGYQHKRFGGYLRFNSNFHKLPATSYECFSDGSLYSGGCFWASGESSLSTFAITGGLLVAANNYLTIYVGAGYGSSVYAWQDIDGAWARVTDISRKGMCADAGVIFSWRRLALSAGISTMSFRTAAFTCGIGVRL